MSGYHMAVVAGVVFFAVRALLALIPGLSVSAPIKNGLPQRRLVRPLFICCCRVRKSRPPKVGGFYELGGSFPRLSTATSPRRDAFRRPPGPGKRTGAPREWRRGSF
jgi:hypothetical protein